MNLRKILRTLSLLIYPPKCPLCGSVTGSKFDGELCNSCRDLFQREFISPCPKCGENPNNCRCIPDFPDNESDISPYTTVTPLVFSGYYTGYDEKSPVSSLVYRMKRDRSSGAAILFGRTVARSVLRYLISNKLDPEDFTVTYIPRSDSAMKKYGFDHMKTVSSTVAELLGCKTELFLKRYGGTEQKALTANERRDNAEETIAVNPRKDRLICGSKVILLDDIITTGASMNVAISALSFAGASLIIPCCVMVTRTKKKPS